MTTHTSSPSIWSMNRHCCYSLCLVSIAASELMGSFLQVIQTCEHCCKTRTWDSQLYVGNVPAGNLLSSAAILYSGSLPSKALRMFEILNITTISRKTYFRHQSKYLQPATDSVWKRKQESILTSLKSKGKQLVLAGDGRSDSPGYSAKFGSYSILELTCNKIVDFQLVQVCNYWMLL